MSEFRRILAVLVVAVGLTGAHAAAPAHAATQKAMWGPSTMPDGTSAFPVYKDLGVGIYETSLAWDRVAPVRPANPRNPLDPAYHWPSELDRAIGEGARFGIEISLLVTHSPSWANGGRPARWAPRRPADFAAFLEAASKRYPGVRYWMIWGEPTKSEAFQPLRPDGGRRLRGVGLRAPRLYARMLDASYAALKRVSRRDLVVGGNTFTVGTVSPRRWIQALRLPNGKPPRMDLYGHNPFSARRPNLRRAPLGRGYADFSDLDQLHGWVNRNLRRKGQRRLRLFLSEFSLPTDHANYEFNFFVSRATQASWLSSALRIVRREPWIYTLGYLSLIDDPERADGQQVERGLIDRAGRQKPAYSSFKRG